MPDPDFPEPVMIKPGAKSSVSISLCSWRSLFRLYMINRDNIKFMAKSAQVFINASRKNPFCVKHISPSISKIAALYFMIIP